MSSVTAVLGDGSDDHLPVGWASLLPPSVRLLAVPAHQVQPDAHHRGLLPAAVSGAGAGPFCGPLMVLRSSCRSHGPAGPAVLLVPRSS